MAGLSRYAQRELLDHMNGASFTAPTNRYVALFTAAAECAGTGYARKLCNSWTVASDADPSVSENSAIIDFGTGNSDWGTITRFAIYDALSAGNLLWDITALTASKVINTGDPVTFPIGALDLTMD